MREQLARKIFLPFISLPEHVEILYSFAMSWAAPFDIVNPDGTAAIVIVCDHASNAVPPAVGDLGVGPEDMQRHIAWDIGALPIARRLAEVFDAPAVICGTSRLVIDCNRKLHDPTLIPVASDGTVIPGNQRLSA